MSDARTPVLIGAGQCTWRARPAPPPRGMLAAAAEAAAADAGLSRAALAGADLLAVVGFTTDAPGTRIDFPRLVNPPAALAADLAMRPRRALYTHMGGNSPQALVNFAAEEIAAGRAEMALLAGAEFLGSLRKKLAAGANLADWRAPEGALADPPERWGDPRPGATPQEAAHGIVQPVNVYPLFENALRAQRGRTLEGHAAAMGRLFAPFTRVAAANPHAWFPTARSAEELIAVSPANRMIGFPYPKYLNAVMNVDQAAAVLMCSSAKADALGVAPERRLYLHGCADSTELWNVLDRVDYHSSPAIRVGAREAFKMAGKTPAEMACVDLYSCFPIAVELACQEIGLPEDDPRGLTITGGLPYFGGPGNNYVMHAIAEMAQRLRARPGAFGLVTANGWYLTKHAFGIYSTAPTRGAWGRPAPASYQAEIDALAHPPVARASAGEAVIETYTVTHARDRRRAGIVIGRDAHGRRFIANTPDDDETLRDLEAREGVGRKGQVSSSADGLRNLFTPA
ncbi:MAG: acetyl-CoA acetyltransferase [Hyphomonadaceae bacterium]